MTTLPAVSQDYNEPKISGGVPLYQELKPIWDNSCSPSPETLKLWKDAGDQLDKKGTIYWNHVVESLDQANAYLQSSTDARQFLEKYLLSITNLMGSQYPSNTAKIHCSFVEISLALAVTIVSQDLEIQLIENGECKILAVLSSVFSKKHCYYVGAGKDTKGHIINGLPEFRLKMVDRFHQEMGFANLYRYMLERTKTSMSPSLEPIRDVLSAYYDSLPQHIPPDVDALSSSSSSSSSSGAMDLVKATMYYLSTSHDNLINLPTDSFKALLRTSHGIFDRFVSIRRDSTYKFYASWRDLTLKLITSKSAETKVFGWKNSMEDLLKATTNHRPPPSEIEVSNAGCEFVNGIYTFTGALTPDGYAQHGVDIKYQRIVPESDEDGGGKKLTLFQCTTMTFTESKPKWWFISEADEELPGTDRDIDYYQHKSVNHEKQYEPPLSGWETCGNLSFYITANRPNRPAPPSQLKTCRQAGAFPAPVLEVSGRVVPDGEEFNTLEHQLAQWVIENGIIELVLSDSSLEVVAELIALIKFLISMIARDNKNEISTKHEKPNALKKFVISMIARDNKNEISTKHERPNVFCLQPSHLLLAWARYTREKDDDIAAKLLDLLVSILPSLPTNLAIPLLKAVEESLFAQHGDNKERYTCFNRVDEFCSALADSVVKPLPWPGYLPRVLIHACDVRAKLMLLLQSLLKHPKSSSLKSREKILTFFIQTRVSLLDHEEVTTSTEILQSNWRGFTCRKKTKPEHTRKLKFVRIIQRYWRGYSVRHNVIKNKAAKTIQTLSRGYLEKTRYQKKIIGVSKLAAVFRGGMARESNKRILSATKINSLVRRFLAKRRYGNTIREGFDEWKAIHGKWNPIYSFVEISLHNLAVPTTMKESELFSWLKLKQKSFDISQGGQYRHQDDQETTARVINAAREGLDYLDDSDRRISEQHVLNTDNMTIAETKPTSTSPSNTTSDPTSSTNSSKSINEEEPHLEMEKKDSEVSEITSTFQEKKPSSSIFPVSESTSSGTSERNDEKAADYPVATMPASKLNPNAKAFSFNPQAFRAPKTFARTSGTTTNFVHSHTQQRTQAPKSLGRTLGTATQQLQRHQQQQTCVDNLHNIRPFSYHPNLCGEFHAPANIMRQPGRYPVGHIFQKSGYLSGRFHAPANTMGHPGMMQMMGMAYPPLLIHPFSLGGAQMNQSYAHRRIPSLQPHLQQTPQPTLPKPKPQRKRQPLLRQTQSILTVTEAMALQLASTFSSSNDEATEAEGTDTSHRKNDDRPVSKQELLLFPDAIKNPQKGSPPSPSNIQTHVNSRKGGDGDQGSPFTATSYDRGIGENDQKINEEQCKEEELGGDSLQNNSCNETMPAATATTAATQFSSSNNFVSREGDTKKEEMEELEPSLSNDGKVMVSNNPNEELRSFIRVMSPTSVVITPYDDSAATAKKPSNTMVSSLASLAVIPSNESSMKTSKHKDKVLASRQKKSPNQIASSSPMVASSTNRLVPILSSSTDDEVAFLSSNAVPPYQECHALLSKNYDNILLSRAALKWFKNADSKFKSLFLRRLKQFANGEYERSFKLRKRLTGCKHIIYEAYLEQKVAYRVIFTECRSYGEDDSKNNNAGKVTKKETKKSILVWYVSTHDRVSRVIKQIDEAEARMNRQFNSSAANLFRDCVDDSVENYEGNPLVLENDTILLDPFANTPLKIHNLKASQIDKIELETWTPPFRLTSDEKKIINSPAPVFVLGRSGTGKTVCIVNRMVFEAECYSSGVVETPLKQLFISRSRRIKDLVQRLVQEVQTVDSRFVERSFASYERIMRDCNSALTNLGFPTTVAATEKSIRHCEFSGFKKVFSENKKGTKLTAIVVWTQIRSYIKGSIEAVIHGRPLTREEYLKLGRTYCRLSKDQRQQAYTVYEKYSSWLKTNGYYDSCDRTADMLNRIQRVSLEERTNNNILFDKIYIDECQDFTSSDFALFWTLCEGGNNLFLAGDTAQSVEQGISFRFEDVKRVFYEMGKGDRCAGARGSLAVPSKPHTIQINFRSHSGILEVAAAVLTMLHDAFPGAANKLKGDEGLFKGPRPSILSCKQENFICRQALQDVVTKNPSLVVLTPDENVAALKEQLGKTAAEELVILGICEAKGLDFDEVIVVDFFRTSSTQLGKAWKELFRKATSSSNRINMDLQDTFPALEMSLKLLYTAITRCRHRLFFVETNQSSSCDGFSRWILGKGLVEKQDVDDLKVDLKSPDEWRSLGIEYAINGESQDNNTVEGVKSWFQRASMCFKQANDDHLLSKSENQAKLRINAMTILSSSTTNDTKSNIKKWDEIKNEMPTLVLECLKNGGYIDEAIDICESLMDRCCPTKEKKFMNAVERALVNMKAARNLM